MKRRRTRFDFPAPPHMGLIRTLTARARAGRTRGSCSAYSVSGAALLRLWAWPRGAGERGPVPRWGVGRARCRCLGVALPQAVGGCQGVERVVEFVACDGVGVGYSFVRSFGS